MDPKSKTMIPLTRIDLALTELKIKIDPDQPVEKQIQDIIKRLPEVMPIKRSEITGVISTTYQYLAQVTGILKKYNVVVQGETYTSEGCDYTVSMVPGDYDKITSELSSSTKGNFDFNIDGQTTTTTTTSEKEAPAKGGRGGGKGGRGGDGGGRGRKK